MVIVNNILLPDFHEDLSQVPNVPVHQYILEKLEKNLQEFGDQEWMTDYSTGQTISYQQVPSLLRSLTSGFRRRGVVEGEFVLFYSHNQVEFPLLQLAVFQCGASFTTIGPTATTDEVLQRCKEVNCKFIICDESSASKAVEVLRLNDLVVEVYVIGKAERCVPISDLLNDDGTCFPAAVEWDLDSIAWLPYSSGTTGPPKGVIHSHRTMLGILHLIRRQPKPGYKVLFVNFMTHIGGTCFGLISLMTHNKCYTLSEFSDEGFVRAINDIKPDGVCAFPPQIGYIVKHPDLSKYDLSSVTSFSTGGSTLHLSFELDLPKKMPNLPHVTMGYGMTEIGIITSNTPYTDYSQSSKSEYKPGSSGKLYPHNQLKVVNEETGQILGPNQEGHICVKNPFITKGYLNHPEATSLLIREDGWVYTGDSGHYDEDGYLFVTGRIKDLIKYRMAPVAPAVLERLLLSLPSVIDAVVVGLPDDIAGELPAAFVVPKGSSSATDEDIVKFIDDHVADEARLRGGVHFIEHIPRNDSGKPLKRKILAEFLEKRSNGGY